MTDRKQPCILSNRDIKIITRVILRHHEEHETEDDYSTDIVNSVSLMNILEKLEDCERQITRIKKVNADSALVHGVVSRNRTK